MKTGDALKQWEAEVEKLAARRTEERNACAAQLRATATRLDAMVKNTVAGGWSTNNVDAMREESTRIWALLGRLGL